MCKHNSVEIKIDGQHKSKKVAANECKVIGDFVDGITYSEIGHGAIQETLDCIGHGGGGNIQRCGLVGMPENACVITANKVCKP